MTQHTVNVVGDGSEFNPERWTPKTYQNGDSNNEDEATKNQNRATSHQNGATTKSGLPDRHPETGINVLIVGAGMGGLMTALECWRKGHNVVKILERNDGPVYSG